MSRFQPWCVRSPEDGIEECSSAEEAKSAAEGVVENCMEHGWTGDIKCLQWGRLVAHEVAELEPGPDRNGEPTYSVKLVRAGDLYVPGSKLREVVAALNDAERDAAPWDESAALAYAFARDLIEDLLPESE